jgi:hypothetical protein
MTLLRVTPMQYALLRNPTGPRDAEANMRSYIRPIGGLWFGP